MVRVNRTGRRARKERIGRGNHAGQEERALLKGAEIHPVLQHHGALYADNDVKMRLKRELISK